MIKSKDYIDCQNEQQFKMKWLKINELPEIATFCIETEETVKGFPDVLCIDKDTKQSYLLEFKYSNAQGKIKFQPTQPAFYKANNDVMNIMIVAYNRKTNTVHEFTVSSLFDKDSPYCLNEKAEVQL